MARLFAHNIRQRINIAAHTLQFDEHGLRVNALCFDDASLDEVFKLVARNGRCCN
jgi:hypothetical protein